MMVLLPVMLLAPTLLLMVWMYWIFPKSLPRTSARRAFDVLALLVALGAAFMLGHAGEIDVVTDATGTLSGAIWPQVLAVLYAYGAFSLVVIVAAWMRWWFFRVAR